MRRFVTRDTTSLKNLTIESVAAPDNPGPGQVRIAMRAAAINYRDLLWVTGAFGQPGEAGLVPCSDGAGEVVEIGDRVTRAAIGDRVALTFNPDWIGGPFRATAGSLGRGSLSIPGTLQDEIVVHEGEVVRMPAHLSYEEGAALPCAGVTAWHALCGAAPLLPGSVVLVQGGGGVSLFALQFAKLFGARVIAISSSSERCALLRQAGADATIDYSADPEWHRAVRDLTDGVGVDLAIDIDGADTIDRSLGSTRIGGRVALVGLIGGWPESPSKLFSTGVDIATIKVGSRDDHEAMHKAIDFHRIAPYISSRYPFEQLPDALNELRGGRHFGKIAVLF